ncbi:MAG: potassium channel family protein, partial [Bacteroidia bacterium]|nr:potassium channel family protein [Bacteroidia bacterium]
IPPWFFHSSLDHRLKVILQEDLRKDYYSMHGNELPFFEIRFQHCEFKGSLFFSIIRSPSDNITYSPYGFRFIANIINTSMIIENSNNWASLFVIRNILPVTFYDNTFDVNGRTVRLFLKEDDFIFIDGNAMAEGDYLEFVGIDNSNLNIENNVFPKHVQMNLNFKNEFSIEWDDLAYKLISPKALVEFETAVDNGTLKGIDLDGSMADKDKFKEFHLKHDKAFEKTQIMFTSFVNHYKEIGDKLSYNKVYVELKDLETAYFKEQYNINPTFETFFTYKVNQFLKVFSAYGTRPAKAVVFSLYVILFFALIYLFFPNSWDKHGKNRLIDRYSFFMKYMNKDAGIHEVYLDDQKEELLQYKEFKTMVESSAKKVPKFFVTTALPLYKWAISGTNLTASFLKRIDIMKGRWEELPPSKRIWKSILLVGAFIIAIAYDLIIKILNALMLSINTFTTLGFGEIPIKGLPRYLAIIQGFIGWFMLTIFSVSLISQLLN